MRIPVRGHCGRRTGLPDRWIGRLNGSKRGAARRLSVTGNRGVTRIGEGGFRTSVVPALPHAAVRARNGAIAAFTGAAPIVGRGIVRRPGKAGLPSPNPADLPAFQHLPRRLDPRDRSRSAKTSTDSAHPCRCFRTDIAGWRGWPAPRWPGSSWSNRRGRGCRYRRSGSSGRGNSANPGSLAIRRSWN